MAATEADASASVANQRITQSFVEALEKRSRDMELEQDMLHDFVTTNTAEIIARTRAKLATRTAPLPTEAELQNGVPLFIGQLVDRLSLATGDSRAIERGAAVHGGELLAMGFTVGQVVHCYGDVCQVITRLAVETGAPITADEFHVFNCCLDDAIVGAVTEYERRRDQSVAGEGRQSLGILADDLRNRVSSAMLAYTILQDGTVGIRGSTGAVLGRSLRGLRDLVNNSLVDLRVESGIGERRRESVADLVRHVEDEACMGADLSAVGLTVPPVAHGVYIETDPQILATAIGNLLQNAFKFSRPRGGVVALRTIVTTARVVFEVYDACGGLAPGKAQELSRSLKRGSADRATLGRGLTSTCAGVETIGGTLGVRDRPEKGCVFSIDLPRLPAA